MQSASVLGLSPEDYSILLVDDDRAVVDITVRMLEQEGFRRLLRAYTGEEALRDVASGTVQAMLLDLGLPDMSGELVLERVKERHPEIPVVVVTALGDVDTAVRCMTKGAFDYVVKGSDPARITAGLRRALLVRRKELEFDALRESIQSASLKTPEAFAPILTVSERMKAIFRFIEAVAPTEEPVLLIGETGVGKELFARAVHEASGRKGAYVAVNLGGIEETMLADTLFGHKSGAYTGAQDVRTGLLASAAGGTLFLDEIGDLGASSQVKLLRLLENREYFPLGSDVPKRSDARIVAATNRDLETLAGEGRFRRDLLYRLSAFQVAIPPLRERTEDIPLLCSRWLGGEKGDEPGPVLSAEALAILARHPFPGNARELRGLMLRTRVLKPQGRIEGEDISSLLGGRPAGANGSPNGRVPVLFPGKLPTIRRMIDDLVEEALSRTGGRQNEAAVLLGITPQALSKRLKNKRAP